MRRAYKNGKIVIRNILLYSVAGATSTGVEGLVFFLLNQKLGLHYAPAYIVALALSTLTNWAVGRFLLFRSTENILKEIGGVYLASMIGMGLNLVLMWIMVDGLGIHEMAAWAIGTVIVFVWNYLIRAKFIYRGRIKNPGEDNSE